MASNTSTSIMALLFAIDFIEKSRNLNATYIPTHRNIYIDSKNPKISKNINNKRMFGVNNNHRATHYIGQPQWRGYSH